jgi:very long chain acyl-CoA dehydrogenase
MRRGTVQLFNVARQTRTSLSTTAVAANLKTDSFIQGLYTNQLVTEHVFPFPTVLDEERLENLSMTVDATQTFFDEVNDADANDENKSISKEAWEGAKELGAFGLLVPEEYGGMAMNNTEYARLSEILLAEDAGFSIAIGAHQSIGYKAILLLGNPEQKQKYLPGLASGELIAAFALTEPSTGSDAASVKTQAVLNEAGTHYIMNGSKIWISNGGICDVLTVFAKVPQKQADGSIKEKMSAFIVERNFGGVKNGPPENKMGIKCSNTAEVFFEDCPIPVENLILEVGDGFKVAMDVLNNGRFGMATGLCGTMRKCIQKSVDHASTRKQFFNTEIHHYGAIQEKIALMNMKLYAAESMAYLLCSSMDNKAVDYGLEAAICKIFSSEAAWWVCDESIQVLGGTGYMRSTELERIMRDLRIFRIFEGTNDILRLFIALTGIKHLGKHSLEPAKAITNKSSTINGKVNGAVWLAKHKMGFTKAEQTIDQSGAVHKELGNSTLLLDKAIQDLQFTASEMTMNYQKKIINPENQMMISRIADATIGIYSCAAVLSRATKAIQEGSEAADHEALMAKTWVKSQTDEIKVSLKEARSHKKHHADMTQISKNVIANGGIVQPHALGI